MVEQEMNDREEYKDDSEGWFEVRLSGALPERRSNHCSFISNISGDEYLYIHGGRDLKEGAIESMWCINLTKIGDFGSSSYNSVEWEQVRNHGKGPGKISHHTACTSPQGAVIFYGGLKGEDSVSDIFIYDVTQCAWGLLMQNNSITPRDDHAMAVADDGSFYVFGGFVNGSRVNELCQCTVDSGCISSEVISTSGPCSRAGHSIAYAGGKMYVFGGQDDDNNKLDDLWHFDIATESWVQVQQAETRPVPRSGHSSVAFGGKMFIFGGIFELTKELNDLCVFDLRTDSFCHVNPDPFACENDTKQEQVMEETPALEKSPTIKRAAGAIAAGAASPTQTRKAASGKMGSIMQPHNLSPPPRRRNQSPSKRANAAEDAEKREKDGLSSPTSISMQQSFIIKNADSSFDAYHQQMKRRGKAGGFATQTEGNNMMSENKFGLVPGKPTARDGHSCNVDSTGNMYVFGGDRHQMPFNDLYMMNIRE